MQKVGWYDMIWGEHPDREMCCCVHKLGDRSPPKTNLIGHIHDNHEGYVCIYYMYIHTIIYIYIYIIYPPKMNTISFSLWKKTFGGSSIHPVDQQRCLMTWSSTTSATVVPKDWYPQPGATSEERSVATVFTKDRDTLVTSRNHGGCRGWNHIMGPYNGAD